jgi:putative tryptophan/tyrosine transport system substrate-binding protein
MRRIALLGTPVIWPRVAKAEQLRTLPRVGFLAMGQNLAQGQHPAFPIFVQALNRLGWTEGKNVMLEARFAEPGKPEQFDQLALDLVQEDVRAIVAVIQPEILAAQRTTKTIPIVMVVGFDPIGQGFAQTLARPGGNITGLAWDADPDFTSKSVEILHEMLPRLHRVGAIIDPSFPETATWDGVQKAAVQLGLDVHPVEVQSPDRHLGLNQARMEYVYSSICNHD